tara:strand:+ start:749 stop:3547 length:2799 start_codon:yes stop_codon:yes gene_type:complete
MATNPLKQLLKTNERFQAKEFRREVSLRPSARPGGQFTVSPQATVSAGQTNLGRMANALAGASNLLAQYSQFQFAKEQEELRQRGVEVGIEQQKQAQQAAAISMQDVDERIVQQEISTNLVNTKIQDQEFDNWWNSQDVAQKEAYRQKVQKEMSLRKERLRQAETRLGNAVGEVPTYDHPLHKDRERRLMGANLKENYIEFLKSRVSDIGESLGKKDGPTITNRDEAKALVSDVYSEYMELKSIDPNSEIGRGFISAVSRANESLFPQLTQTLLDESERISINHIEKNLYSYTKDGSPISFGPTKLDKASFIGQPPETEAVDALVGQINSLSPDDFSLVRTQLREEGLISLNPDNYTIQRTGELVAEIKAGDTQEPESIKETAGFQKLQDLPSQQILSIIGGDPSRGGAGGLILKSSATYESASRFLATLHELGDTLIVDGRLLKEHPNYDGYLATLDAKIADLSTFDTDKRNATIKRVEEQVRNESAMLVLRSDSTTIRSVIANLATLSGSQNPEDFDKHREFMEPLMPKTYALLQELPSEFRADEYVKIAKNLANQQQFKDSAIQVWAENNSWFEKVTEDSVFGSMLKRFSSGHGPAGQEIDAKTQGYIEDLLSSTGADAEAIVNGVAIIPRDIKVLFREQFTQYDTALQKIVEEDLNDQPLDRPLDPKAARERIGDRLVELNLNFRQGILNQLKGFYERDKTAKETLDKKFEEVQNRRLRKGAKGAKGPEGEQGKAGFSGSNLSTFIAPGGEGRKTMGSIADAIAIGKDLTAKPTDEEGRTYSQMYADGIEYVQEQVKLQYANVLDIKRAFDVIVSIRDGLNKDPKEIGSFVVLDRDYFLNLPESNVSEDVSVTNEWMSVRKSVKLAADHFEKNKPLVVGLPKDKQTLENAINETGISEDDFNYIAKQFGFSNAEAFLKFQYDQPYYKS